MFSKMERPPLLNHIRCPECGVPMVERTGQRGRFFGCARFPLCVGTRPEGEGVDSYTKLLREAYTKAVVFLASPRFMGVEKAAAWLMSKGLQREVSNTANEVLSIQLVKNETLERAIDAACEYVAEKGIDIDFLLKAHEERLQHIRAKLRYETDAAMMRRMPRAEIQRRYDMSTFEQLEADLAPEGRSEGRYCPRCGGWSEKKSEKNDADELNRAFRMKLSEAEIAALFERLDKSQTSSVTYDCGTCGVYSYTRKSERNASSACFSYQRDADDAQSLPGTELPDARSPFRRER